MAHHGQALRLAVVAALLACKAVLADWPRFPGTAGLVCNDGRALAAALADPFVSTILLPGDCVLRESDFDGLALPIVLGRNLTIMGSAIRPVTLDLGFVRAKVVLAGAAVLTLSRLALLNYRAGSMNQAPGLDLLAPSAAGWPAPVVEMRECVILYRLCFPAAVARQAFKTFARPSQIPGEQAAEYPSPMPAADTCTNRTDAPLVERCFAGAGFYIDYAVIGADVRPNGSPAGNNYLLHFIDTYAACETVMSDDCLTRFGPLGCVLYMQSFSPPPPPPPVVALAPLEAGGSGGGGGAAVGGYGSGGANTSAAAGGAGGGSDGSLAVALGCAIGGALLLLVLVLLMALARAAAKRRGKAAVEAAGASTSRAAETEPHPGPSKLGEAGGEDAAEEAHLPLPPPAPPLQHKCAEEYAWNPGSVGSGLATLLPLEVAAVTELTPKHPGLRLDARLAPYSLCTKGSKQVTKGFVTCTTGDGPGAAEATGELAAGACSADPAGSAAERPAGGGGGGAAMAAAHSGGADVIAACDANAPSGGDNVVTLLPTVLGKGACGRVHVGMYGGRRVAVKVIEDCTDAYGLAHPPPQQEHAGGQEHAPQREQQSADEEAAAQQHQQRCGDGKALAPQALAQAGQQQLQQQQQGVESLFVSSVAAELAAAASCSTPVGAGVFTACTTLPPPQQRQEELMRLLAQEVEVLGRCEHPNIVRLLAACLTPPRVCLVMELMDTSLEHLLFAEPRRLLPLPMVLHMAVQIVQGLAYLHPSVMHRDLKPANVLVSGADTARPVVKLADFGLARIRSATLPTLSPEAGTPAYTAPEAYDVHHSVITHRADMFSLGTLLWVMLTGQQPWKDHSVVAVAFKVAVLGERLPLAHLTNQRCPPKLRKLIEQCWEADPLRRPAAADALKTLFLAQQQIDLWVDPTQHGTDLVFL